MDNLFRRRGSLAAQGGQRLPSYFNIERGNSVDLPAFVENCLIEFGKRY